MIILSILIGIFGIGIILLIFNSITSHDFELSGIFITIFGGLFLILALIVLGVNHISLDPMKAEYKQASISLEESRKSNSDIERAAVVQTVIKLNTNLASKKEYQKSIWVGIFFPVGVQQIEMIK